MNDENSNLIKGIHIILHTISTPLIFALAYGVRNCIGVTERLSPLYGFDKYILTMMVACLLWPIIFSTFKLYGLRDKSFLYFLKIVLASAMGCIFLISILFFQRDTEISRLFLIIFYILDVLIVISVDQIYQYVVREILKNKYYKRRVLIVVSENLQKELIKNIKINESYYMGIADIITIKNGEHIKDFSSVLVNEIIDEVLFGLNKEDSIKLEEYVICCETMGITSNIAISVYELPRTGAQIGTVGLVPVLKYATIPQDQTKLFIKRIADIFGAILGLIITVGISIILIPVLKIESKGPVFFKQNRVGKNGRVFKLYKFRSMCNGAEDMKKALEQKNEMQGAMFKIANDPRVTKTGKIIRKMSIDELPQFWNVLKGDLSLVGTRPPTTEEVEKYQEHHWKRLSMKPGLTGIWQTSGRNKVMDFEEIVRMDVEYIDNWSLKLDLKLLLKTVKVVLFGYGAC